MCSSTPKAPKPQPQPVIPPPPPAPEAPPKSPAMNESDTVRTNEDASRRARRIGTQSLRIDLNMGGSGSTGLNIPQ